jgi:hypothetical protein
MLAPQVVQALPVEDFLELFFGTGSLFSAGRLFHGFWLALPSSPQVLGRVLVACSAVGFHFFTLLPPGNNDIAGVPASVDDGSTITRGEVVEVMASLLVVLTVQCLR